MDHNQRLIKIAKLGVNEYIAQALANGDKTEVIVGILSEPSFQTADFFQDKNNHHYYFNDANSETLFPGMEGWGHASRNIANALAVTKAFLTTPLSLDIDFLNSWFDGVNTPGLFCLISSDVKWLADFKQKHGMTFAQTVSALFLPHLNSGRLTDDTTFKISKRMADFLNDFDKHFISDYGQGIELLPSPAPGQEPVSFVRQQLDAMSLAHSLQLMVSYMADYADNVCMQHIEPELLVESIQAVRVFAASDKEKIDRQIEQSISQLILPEEVIALCRKMLSADVFQSLNDELFNETTPSGPQIY